MQDGVGWRMYFQSAVCDLTDPRLGTPEACPQTGQFLILSLSFLTSTYACACQHLCFFFFFLFWKQSCVAQASPEFLKYPRIVLNSLE